MGKKGPYSFYVESKAGQTEGRARRFIEAFAAVLGLEFLPAVLEHPWLNRPIGHRLGRALKPLTIPLVIAGTLLLYLFLRLGDLAARGMLGHVLETTWESGLFFLELGLSALVPAILLLLPRVRFSPAGLAVCAAMTAAGMVLYRMDLWVHPI